MAQGFYFPSVSGSTEKSFIKERAETLQIRADTHLPFLLTFTDTLKLFSLFIFNSIEKKKSFYLLTMLYEFFLNLNKIHSHAGE